MGIKSFLYIKKEGIKTLLGKKNIRIQYKNGLLKVVCPHTFEDRGIKTLELFMIAFEKAKARIEGNFCLDIMTEDFPEHCISRGNKLAYSKARDSSNEAIIPIPDFSFVNWKETGMDDYERCRIEMMKAGELKPENDTLFWIGNAKTHPSREVLCNLSSVDPRIEAYSMGWDYRNGKAIPNKYVSLVDHTKYKYLIDIQGRGWSARTKILMFSGRCLFIADRKWKEYWYDYLVPYLHYIPVKEDLSDLSMQLDWAESHPEEVEKIVKNAREFALKYLTREAAIRYFEDVIVECSKSNGGRKK